MQGGPPCLIIGHISRPVAKGRQSAWICRRRVDAKAQGRREGAKRPEQRKLVSFSALPPIAPLRLPCVFASNSGARSDPGEGTSSFWKSERGLSVMAAG